MHSYNPEPYNGHHIPCTRPSNTWICGALPVQVLGAMASPVLCRCSMPWSRWTRILMVCSTSLNSPSECPARPAVCPRSYPCGILACLATHTTCRLHGTWPHYMQLAPAIRTCLHWQVAPDAQAMDHPPGRSLTPLPCPLHGPPSWTMCSNVCRDHAVLCSCILCAM